MNPYMIPETVEYFATNYVLSYDDWLLMFETLDEYKLSIEEFDDTTVSSLISAATALLSQL